MVRILGIGGLAGVALGAAVGLQESGDLGNAARFVGAVSKEVAVSQGIARASAPPPGAYYRYCADARAAGVAPLYAGEPGYRPALDRDGDGVACEPYRGR
ncbi:MAG: excalibur calcium-binding domain-containing protein [Thermoleophilia bacterium]|nr:excalibur calcium-binding domain-containing protein [Thermoleophilia bacterium]